MKIEDIAEKLKSLLEDAKTKKVTTEVFDKELQNTSLEALEALVARLTLWQTATSAIAASLTQSTCEHRDEASNKLQLDCPCFNVAREVMMHINDFASSNTDIATVIVLMGIATSLAFFTAQYVQDIKPLLEKRIAELKTH